MKKNTSLILIIILFLILVCTNILTSVNTLERGDYYFNILFAESFLHNLRPIGNFDLFMQNSDVFLNHPPLYIYLLTLVLFLFKLNWSLNFVNPLLVIITGIVLLQIINLISKKNQFTTSLIILSLFLLMPLTIQSSYLVDVDVLLSLSMVLFTYNYLKNPNRIILNSFLFMLIWFVKIQGIPIMVASLFFFLVLLKKSKKDFINLFLILLISSGLFFSIIYFYTAYFGVSFSRMFAHSSIIGMILKQLSNPVRASLTSFWSLKQLIFWIVPSTALLYLAGICEFCKNKSWKTNEKLLLPILISVFTLLELIPIETYGWNFPKYYAEFIPFMLLSITPIIKKIKFDKKDITKILILLLITINYFLLIPDPYLPEVSEAFTEKEYLPLILDVLFNFDLLIFPVIFVLIFYKKDKFNASTIYKILLISSMIIFLGVGIMQITKPYSTNNLYGDIHSDLSNILKYLKENTHESDRAFLFPHVGYYFGNENNTNWYNSMLCYNSEDCIKKVIEDENVKFMQFYPKDLKRLNGNLQYLVEKEFEFNINFGEYILYKRK